MYHDYGGSLERKNCMRMDKNSAFYDHGQERLTSSRCAVIHRLQGLLGNCKSEVLLELAMWAA